MRNTLLSLGLLASLAFVPATAGAATIAASLIPDGTYTVKVEKVVDSKHLVVLMDNGAETTLEAGRPNVDFGKVSAGDSLKLSTGTGKVLVFADLGKA